MSEKTGPLLYDARRLLVYVEDLERSVAFYRDVLGFKPLRSVPGTNYEFGTSGAPLVLHRDGKAASQPRGRVGFMPSFAVTSDIQQVIETLRERGVRIVDEVLEVPHGWIAFIADIEGNLLQIYQAKGEHQ